jgi:hypothetical protein
MKHPFWLPLPKKPPKNKAQRKARARDLARCRAVHPDEGRCLGRVNHKPPHRAGEMMAWVEFELERAP